MSFHSQLRSYLTDFVQDFVQGTTSKLIWRDHVPTRCLKSASAEYKIKHDPLTMQRWADTEKKLGSMVAVSKVKQQNFAKQIANLQTLQCKSNWLGSEIFRVQNSAAEKAKSGQVRSLVYSRAVTLNPKKIEFFMIRGFNDSNDSNERLSFCPAGSTGPDPHIVCF